MPTIAHISDLHLQSAVPARQAQVEPILQKINAMKPDLVVISGDVTHDGWDSIDELRWAKDWLDNKITMPKMVIPGNHDVGNFISLPEGPITSQRAQNWFDVFGKYKIGVFGTWCVFALNSMLHGSGLDEEHDQQLFVRDYLERVRSQCQRLAVFLHSPLFIAQPDEAISPDAGYWLGPSQERSNLYADLHEAGLKLIGSGHVHQTRLTEVDGIKIAWAPPASGTWVHAPGLPNPPRPKQTGFFLHRLQDDGQVQTELIECAPTLKLYEHDG